MNVRRTLLAGLLGLSVGCGSGSSTQPLEDVVNNEPDVSAELGEDVSFGDGVTVRDASYFDVASGSDVMESDVPLGNQDVGYGSETIVLDSVSDISLLDVISKPDILVEDSLVFTDVNDSNGGCDTLAPYFIDADCDGFGSGDFFGAFCDDPSTAENCYVTNYDDVDDFDELSFPGATEICDSKDNDGNGLVDDGIDMQTFYLDADGDGFGGSGILETCVNPDPTLYVLALGDCLDVGEVFSPSLQEYVAASEIHPGAEELCDLLDNNCNELIDENPDNVVNPLVKQEECESGKVESFICAEGTYTSLGCSDSNQCSYDEPVKLDACSTNVGECIEGIETLISRNCYTTRNYYTFLSSSQISFGVL